MKNFKWFAFFALAFNLVSALSAENGCPGNSESLQFRLANRHQIIVAVSVNHSGPFPFLLDTGSQISVLDSRLADALHLALHGEAVVAGAGFNDSASFGEVESIEAGSRSVRNSKLIVYNLQSLRSADLSVQGILGEDVLEQFDLLIDNAHHAICLGDPNTMGTEVKGTHIGLLSPDVAQDGARLPESLIVSAKLSDGMRPVRLKLDSGTNTPFLYGASEVLALGAFRGASWHGVGANGAQRAFSALPAQDVKIGSVQLSKVGFITSTSVRKDARTSNFDGLLATGLFRRVFINHAEHYVVLDPW
jgi:hypothetical protein